MLRDLVRREITETDTSPFQSSQGTGWFTRGHSSLQQGVGSVDLWPSPWRSEAPCSSH